MTRPVSDKSATGHKADSPAKKLALALAILAIVLLLCAGAWLVWLHSPIEAIDTADERTIMVEPGRSLSAIAGDLADQQILDFPKAFILWAMLRGDQGSIRAGEYELNAGLSPAGLLQQMITGRTKQHSVTLVEGWTALQALNVIRAHDKVEVTLSEGDDSEILGALDVEQESLEGLLFPDTYFFDAGTTDRAILRRALQRMQSVLQEEWAARLGALPYNSPYEALIMASIVEKESGLHSERQRIAGVFVRRLEQGMRLQSDPTVIYGIGASYDGDIRREDLRTTTAYNTYRIDGLPPTPIALPGREAIHAALQPESGPYLYFVSRGDGSHYFSATLEEHNEAVRRFQLTPDPAQPTSPVSE